MRIDAPIEDLWSLITKPGNLNLFHPFCKSNEVTKWVGVGSKDVLTYLNGMTFFRDFIDWENKKGYTLLIGRKNGQKSKVEWKINSLDNEIFLSITVYPHLLNSFPRFITYLPYSLLIKPKLKKYLNSVISGINWYLVNKRPVPKNHFGKHAWFSKF
jgi:hypothetical protein